ncbi:MAG: hypothetical protein ACFFCX_17810, partial [Candidatus Sifarchaeia archaeon]
MRIEVDRWREAQDAEASVTLKLIEEARVQSAPRFQKYIKRMRTLFDIGSFDKILDIGCKYYGLITFIEKGDHYFLDPLLAILPKPNFIERKSYTGLVAVG